MKRTRIKYTVCRILAILWLATVILAVTIGAFLNQTEIVIQFNVNSIKFSVSVILVIFAAAVVAALPYAIVEYVHDNLED